MLRRHENEQAPAWRAGRLDGGGYSKLKVAVFAVFIALVGAAGFVVFMLPSQVSQAPPSSAAVEKPQSARPTAPPAVPPHPSAQPGTPAATVADADKAAAEQLLTEALRRLTQLESDGVRAWGLETFETSLPAAEETLAKARAHFDSRKYALSLPLFKEAIAAFDRLAASRPERFDAAMNRGRKALEDQDAPAATRQFEIALALMPANQEAKALLDRSRALPAVLDDVAKGKELEVVGDIDQARERFQAAVARDPDFALAREHLARVTAAIAARDYRQAVSDALGRLEKRDFKGAQAAIDRAGKIKPNAPEVKEISGRIQTEAQAAALDALRRRAAGFESQEKWSDALSLYDAALKIDKSAGFAVRGRDRARTFVAFHKAIDSYLAEPIRLQSPEPLAHAKTLLTESDRLGDAGKILNDKTKRLRTLISQAEAPIPVVIESDRVTDVTVYRIGRLGSFDSRRVELKPGNYTAVGSRPGYRDVRVEFKVAPASSGETVAVRCTDPIQ